MKTTIIGPTGAHPHERRIERRRGPDIWIRLLRWISAVGWLLMLVTLIVLQKAKPHTKTFFDRYYNIADNFRSQWDKNLLQYIFYCMVIGFFLSLIGLCINKTRHRRRDDTYRINLIVIGIISIIGIVIYLF